MQPCHGARLWLFLEMLSSGIKKTVRRPMTLLVRMYPCRFANHAHHLLKLYEKGVLIVAL